MTGSGEITRPYGNTLRIRAQVLATGGRRLSGYLHLQQHAPSHAGPESPEDLLARPGGFFPLTDEQGRTVFICKDQVLAISTDPETTFTDPDRRSAARSLRIRVELSDGTEFAGLVALEMPPDRPRPLDFLNESRGFFALAEPDAIRYLNRQHLRVVTPSD